MLGRTSVSKFEWKASIFVIRRDAFAGSIESDQVCLLLRGHFGMVVRFSRCCARRDARTRMPWSGEQEYYRSLKFNKVWITHETYIE